MLKLPPQIANVILGLWPRSDENATTAPDPYNVGGNEVLFAKIQGRTLFAGIKKWPEFLADLHCQTASREVLDVAEMHDPKPKIAVVQQRHWLATENLLFVLD